MTKDMRPTRRPPSGHRASGTSTRSFQKGAFQKGTAKPAGKSGPWDADLTPRAAAVLALSNVFEHGRYLDEAFAAALKPYPNLSPSDRGFVRMLLTTTLRRLGQLDAVIKGHLANPGRPLPDRVRHALRLGAAQLLFLGTPAHAAVDTTVRLVAADPSIDIRRFKGLANAVLRRISEDGARAVAAQDAAGLSGRLNTPNWLWSAWVHRFGLEGAEAIAAAHLTEPALDLTLKPGVDASALQAALTAVGYDAQTSPVGGLRLRQAGAIEALPGYEGGDWWVQDAAATLAVRLMPVVGSERVLDLCAAPGGKTAQLAAAGALVTALDVSAKRLDRVRENLERLKLSADLVKADAADYTPAALFDHVLLDAPCSATGTLRRHPDGAWLKRSEDVAALAETQAKLLTAAARMVKLGGTLLYCVCSLQAEEGPRQIGKFLAVRQDFERVPVTAAELPAELAAALLENGDVQTRPDQAGGVDGFYIARLRRAA